METVLRILWNRENNNYVIDGGPELLVKPDWHRCSERFSTRLSVSLYAGASRDSLTLTDLPADDSQLVDDFQMGGMGNGNCFSGWESSSPLAYLVSI